MKEAATQLSPVVIKEQAMFLRKIKKMRIKDLRKYHRKVFGKSKYWTRPRTTTPRFLLERRLYYAYCLKNYHFPQDTEMYKKFKEIALKLLSQKFTFDSRWADSAVNDDLEHLRKYTKEGFAAMSDDKVSAFLVKLGVHVVLPAEHKRQLLWEIYCGTEQQELFSYKTGAIIRMGSNKYMLKDIILQFPDMPYSIFLRRFGEKMPTVSRGSYNSMRNNLKSQGHNIPSLRRGPDTIREAE